MKFILSIPPKFKLNCIVKKIKIKNKEKNKEKNKDKKLKLDLFKCKQLLESSLFNNF